MHANEHLLNISPRTEVRELKLFIESKTEIYQYNKQENNSCN